LCVIDQRGKPFPVQPIDTPVVQVAGTEALVEADGVLVPVEHGPLEAAAPTACSFPRAVEEEGVSDLCATMLRQDEQVFKVEGR
jgi:hypothetical protein